MAANATLTVNVAANTSSATKGIDNTTESLDRMGREARTASDRIDDVGGKAGGTTTGLRDMADAVEMIGFPGLAAGMSTAAVGFEAIDGAATLFATHSAFLTKALGGVTKAMNLLKVSILTNPIFIIVAVIVAIVAAFVLLYMKCETFRKIVDKVFKFAWNLIKGFWNFIKSAFTLLISILMKPFQMWMAIIKTVIGWVRTAFNAWWTFIKSIFSKVLNVIKGPFEKAFNWVKNAIDGLMDKFRGIVTTITNVFKGVFDAIKKPFEKAINWVKDHFKLPKLPSWIPGVGKAAPAVYVPGPRVGGGTRAAVGAGVVINFNGPVGDPHAVTRQLRRMFRDDEARLGRYRPSPVGAP